MKKFAHSTTGVTLLEVMLVLAVAAMIILMSVRYYQSVNANQAANTALQQIEGITAAADTLSQGSGSYATGGVSSTTIANLLPGGATSGLTTPWGTTITISGATASTYAVALPSTPVNVCPLLRTKLTQDNHFTNVANCNAAAVTNFTYTYQAHP